MHGWSSAGSRGDGDVDELDVVVGLEERIDHRADVRLGLGGAAVRGEAVAEVDGDRVGHHVAGDAALDAHHLERLVEPAAQDLGLTRLVGVDGDEQRAESVDGVAAHPRPGRVGPGAAQRDAEPQRALAARLDLAVGRFTEHGDIALEQVGALFEELAQPAVHARHLFAGVEDVGDVDGRFGVRRGRARA